VPLLQMVTVMAVGLELGVWVHAYPGGQGSQSTLPPPLYMPAGQRTGAEVATGQ
jgi:hypothetical protein